MATLFDAHDDAPGRVYYRGFTLDHGRDAARADFVRRFGVEPDRMIEGPSILLVGPVPMTDTTQEHDAERTTT